MRIWRSILQRVSLRGTATMSSDQYSILSLERITRIIWIPVGLSMPKVCTAPTKWTCLFCLTSIKMIWKKWWISQKRILVMDLMLTLCRWYTKATMRMKILLFLTCDGYESLSKSNPYPISWATAVISAAETSLRKEGITDELSLAYLETCLPKTWKQRIVMWLM